MSIRDHGTTHGTPYIGRTYTTAMESPTETRRKELPRGDGSWAGYEHVYRNIAAACELMARAKYLYLSEEHINSMAVLGCGDEETMKYEQMRLRGRGFIL